VSGVSDWKMLNTETGNLLNSHCAHLLPRRGHFSRRRVRKKHGSLIVFGYLLLGIAGMTVTSKMQYILIYKISPANLVGLSGFYR
jgi:hypothetical protein